MLSLAKKIAIISFFLILTDTLLAQKIYVVERERGALSVVENGKKIAKITNLGVLHHATVKFDKGFGYVISRDGYLSRIDLKNDTIVKKCKVGDSTIGLTFTDNHIVVANYRPHNVVILDQAMNIVKKIETGSRNVGIKTTNKYLVFSLMDKDQIWVLSIAEKFKLQRKFEKVGSMPFDALLAGNLYVVGFFKEKKMGILDLNKMAYNVQKVPEEEGHTIFKIPHFGLWGVAKNQIFVPGTSQKKLHILERNTWKYAGAIETPGLPVFAILSPKKDILCVNYSGNTDSTLTIIDVQKRQIIKNIQAGRRIMHMRFSNDGARLYFSSYFDNQLKIFNTQNWKLQAAIAIAQPSGIFISPFIKNLSEK